jgi:NAD(P)-dependent dehydrogenase (short-subunit alcohol dehydrogenase family)
MDFKGQVGIVTGGTRGIGKAIAEELAQKGVNLVVAARTREAAHEVAVSLSTQDVKVLGMKLDVSNAEEVEKVFEATRKEFGRVDILVNNKGRAVDENERGCVGRCYGHQPERCLSLLQGSHQGHDKAAVWENYQYYLCCRIYGKSGTGKLQCFKGRNRWLYQDGCP